MPSYPSGERGLSTWYTGCRAADTNIGQPQNWGTMTSEGSLSMATRKRGLCGVETGARNCTKEKGKGGNSRGKKEEEGQVWNKGQRPSIGRVDPDGEYPEKRVEKRQEACSRSVDDLARYDRKESPIGVT
ncbi:unnamed protein product [Boreogadus saida]